MEPVSSVQVVDRVVAILEVVASAGAQGCRLKDIIEALGLKRATAYRLVASLRSHGLIMLGPDGHHYQIGMRFLSLGGRASSMSTLRDIARPSLLRLASMFGDSFFSFVHDGYETVCIDYREGNYPVASYARGVGGRVPVGVGQASIAILAFLPQGERDEILAHNHDILTGVYGIAIENLLAEIAATQERGYSLGTGSLRIPEYTGVGVPVFNDHGRPVAAISCSALVGRFLAEKRKQMTTMMISEAKIIQGQINPLDPFLVAPIRT